MDTFILFLEQFSVGILAILIYNVISFRKYLTDPNLRVDIRKKVWWEALWLDSQFIWIWSIIVIFLLSVTINLVPQTASVIKDFFKWDIADSVESFFLLGLSISAGLDDNKKK